MPVDEEGFIVLDFDTVMLPEGEYNVRITSVKRNMKKNATKDDFPYIEFHYFVESRVDGEEIAPELIGTDVMDICSENPTARWKLKAVLEAFTCHEWGEKGMAIVPSELIGLEAIAMLVHDSYNGVQRAKPAKVWNPNYVPPEKPVDEPSADVWDEFNQQQ